MSSIPLTDLSPNLAAEAQRHISAAQLPDTVWYPDGTAVRNLGEESRWSDGVYEVTLGDTKVTFKGGATKLEAQITWTYAVDIDSGTLTATPTMPKADRLDAPKLLGIEPRVIATFGMLHHTFSEEFIKELGQKLSPSYDRAANVNERQSRLVALLETT